MTIIMYRIYATISIFYAKHRNFIFVYSTAGSNNAVAIDNKIEQAMVSVILIFSKLPS